MKNITSLFVLLSLLILPFSSSSFAQQRFKTQQRFKAGLLAGFNAAQLDGDLRQGFDKWGLTFGARGVIVLSSRFELSTEILFSPRGSRFERDGFRSGSKSQMIKLNYMEVPILINYLMKPTGTKKDKYYKNHISTGISVGRLINSSVEEFGNDRIRFAEAVEFFNKNDLSYILGFTHYLYRHIGLGFRATISVNKIFDEAETPLQDPENELASLRGYFISGRILYMF